MFGQLRFYKHNEAVRVLLEGGAKPMADAMTAGIAADNAS